MKLLTCTGLRPQTGFRTETSLAPSETRSGKEDPDYPAPRAPLVDRPPESAGFYRQKHAALRALK